MIGTIALEKQRARLRRFTSLYAQMLLNGSIDWDKLGLVYNTKELLPEVKARRILRTKTAQEMVTEELINIYKDKGIDASKVIDEELALLDSCKNESGRYEDRSNAIKIIGNWRESLELKPKQQTTQREETNYLSFINKKQGKIEAKQVIKSIEQGTDDTSKE